MTWSPKQRTLLLVGANAACWNDAQRYLAMRHAGCPNDPKVGRPGVKHPGNTDKMFARVMALAEAQDEGAVPPPREFPSWRDAANAELSRAQDFAKQIAAEAVKRLPLEFALPDNRTADADTLPTSGAVDRLLTWAVGHVTANDSGEFAPFKPATLDECDAGQLYRVTECLKAVVGRKLHLAGLVPESFALPASVKRRGARSQPARGSTGFQPVGGAA